MAVTGVAVMAGSRAVMAVAVLGGKVLRVLVGRVGAVAVTGVAGLAVSRVVMAVVVLGGKVLRVLVGRVGAVAVMVGKAPGDKVAEIRRL